MMTRKLCALTLTLLLLLSLSAAALAAGETETLEYYVSDAANILTSQQQQSLEKAAREASEKHACGIYIITINDFRDFGFSSVDACAEGFFNHYQMGLGNERNMPLVEIPHSRNECDLCTGELASAAPLLEFLGFFEDVPGGLGVRG